MDVKDVRQISAKFRELSPGDVFCSDSFPKSFIMKIEETTLLDGTKRNAVNLKYGNLHLWANEAIVQKVRNALVIGDTK